MSDGKEIFDMVYQWGRVGVVVDHTAPAFQADLVALIRQSNLTTLKRIQAQIRGEGEPGNAGEMISVNEACQIIDEAIKEADNA